MLIRSIRTCRSRLRAVAVLSVAIAVVCLLTELRAGLISRVGAVGGVAVDAEGVLNVTDVRVTKELRATRQAALDEVSDDLSKFTELRKVSLRGLEEAIAKHRATQATPLPDHIRFLAGLQQIRYVFFYPERRDVVLVGPAEGWKADALGNVVGLTTERPVLHVDDLMVALRTARDARQNGMSCSIDPTPEGMARLQQLLASLRTIGNPQDTMQRIENALGPQVITVSGVPKSSNFARIMVAADFRMKRLAMNFEPSPVAELPSFLSMMKARGGRAESVTPRWWLAPKAEPVLADPNGLAWQLRGLTVKCMTENDFFDEDGKRQQTGKAGALAKRWADLFTANFDEMAKKDSVFGQLRGLMDLAVVAALIQKENLLDRAGIAAPHLTRDEPLMEFNIPRSVDSRASAVQRGRNWIVSASGGVQMFPSDIADLVEQSDKLAEVRTQTATRDKRWWWD